MGYLHYYKIDNFDRSIIKNIIRNDIVTFEKERDANKKAFDKIRQYADDLQRERDLVRKDLQRSERTVQDQAEQMRMHEQKIKQLGVEITHHLEAAQKQRSMIGKLEKERDKNLEEAQVLSDKLEQCQGTSRECEMRLLWF